MNNQKILKASINCRNKSVNLKIRWRFYRRIHSRWRKQQHLYHHRRMLKWQSCKLKWLLWIDNWLKQKKQRTRGFNSCKKCMKLRTNLSKNWVSKITNWIKRSRLRIRGNSWYKKCLKLRKNWKKRIMKSKNCLKRLIFYNLNWLWRNKNWLN